MLNNFYLVEGMEQTLTTPTDEDDIATTDMLTLIIFGMGVACLLFFFLMEICPPLCRLAKSYNPRRYEDTALKYGDV